MEGLFLNATTKPLDAKQDLTETKIKILKASCIWNLYAENFGEEYAIKATHYTRKMLDDDMNAVKQLEAELDET